MSLTKLDTTFLRSKVARRIFLLFVVCALLPIAVLALISFTRVANQLYEHSQRRLHRTSKAIAMSIYERLSFLEADMKVAASKLLDFENGALVSTPSERLEKDLEKRFKGLAFVTATGRYLPLFGRIQDPPGPTPAERQHIMSGKSVVSSVDQSDQPARIFMIRALDPQRLDRGILLGEINQTHLWGIRDPDTLPPFTELCVLDQSQNTLICSNPDLASISGQAALKRPRSATGRFEWRSKGKEYLASYWTIPLKFTFFVPQWTVVLLESKAIVLAPMANFKRTFPLVILMSLWVVLLLSLSQIRRSLGPLEKLQEGTRRIAMRDFASRVTVSSGDEFEDLATSFNAMADRLGKQFNTLATMADIDRAILSSLDTERIVRTVLVHMRDVLPCNGIAVSLLDANDNGKAQTYFCEADCDSKTSTETINLPPKEIQKFRNNPESTFTGPGEAVPDFLLPLARHGAKSFLTLPVFLNGDLSAIISVGQIDSSLHNEENLAHARQLADQVAVAIQNSRLYERITNQAIELERANKMKSEFLSVISHELRTPLNVIMSYTELVTQKMLGEINEEQEKALTTALGRSNHLLRMINGVLEATALEAGTVKVASQEVNLGHLLSELKFTYNVPADKDLALEWIYPADLSCVKTDRDKLEKILRNLIDNAIKFTEKGKVTVSARFFADSGKAEFEVKDTGIGIPKESLPVIFEIFRQADSSDRRVYEGVGLGLYVVKKLTHLLGGKVEVESEPGLGSRFTVTIPEMREKVA